MIGRGACPLLELAGQLVSVWHFFSIEKERTQNQHFGFKFELEPIQTQMAQKPMLRAEVHARALRASQNAKRAEVLVGA
jgi:hypothetical protein